MLFCTEKTKRVFICMKCNRRSLRASLPATHTQILCSHGRAERDRARIIRGFLLQLAKAKQTLLALFTELYNLLNIRYKGSRQVGEMLRITKPLSEVQPRDIKNAFKILVEPHPEYVVLATDRCRN